MDDTRDRNIDKLNDLLGKYRFDRTGAVNVDGLIVKEAAKLYADAIAREREKRGQTISTQYGNEKDDLEFAEYYLYQAIDGIADMPEAVEDFESWAEIDLENEETE